MQWIFLLVGAVWHVVPNSLRLCTTHIPEKFSQNASDYIEQEPVDLAEILYEMKNYNTVLSKNGGYDMRNPKEENDTENQLVILKIREMYKKMNLLRTLENSKVGLKVKADLVEIYDNENTNKSKYVYDITSGGLYNDWARDI